MKCDELKAINAYQLTTNTEDSDVYIHNDEFGCGGDLVECYLKSEADEAIADKDKEIAELKADYSAEVEELCIEKTNVDTLEQAWKKSQRALWLMRACFCGRSSEYFSGMASRCKIGQEDFYKEVSEKARRYLKASYKCQAMVKKLR